MPVYLLLLVVSCMYISAGTELRYAIVSTCELLVSVWYKDIGASAPVPVMTENLAVFPTAYFLPEHFQLLQDVDDQCSMVPNNGKLVYVLSPKLTWFRTSFLFVTEVNESDTYTFEMFCENSNFKSVDVQITSLNYSSQSSFTTDVLFTQKLLGGFAINFPSGTNTIEVTLTWMLPDAPNGPMSFNASFFSVNEVVDMST